jgi:hypothetical protein
MADRQAKRGAKMSYLARGMATPEGDLQWTFACRESGTARGGIKKALKRNAQDNHWRTIQSQTGQGACLTYLRKAGVPIAALTRGGRFTARILTDTLPTMKNECRRWPHVYG